MAIEPQLSELRQEIAQKRADLAASERKLVEVENARLLSLHAEVGLSDIQTLISRLQNLSRGKKPAQGVVSPEVKAKIKADLAAKLPVPEIMAKHSVSARQVTSLQAPAAAKPASAKP